METNMTEKIKENEVKPEAVVKKPAEKTPVKKAVEKDVVATGKAITSKKGILGPGDEVKAGYLSGGESTLKDLQKKGFIVKG